MPIRPALEGDFDSLFAIYHKGNQTLSAAQAAADLRARLTDAAHLILLSETTQGAVDGAVFVGPDPEGFADPALHILSVKPDGFGRRLAGTLFVELKRHLIARRAQNLWIRTEPEGLPFFIKQEATEVGLAQPSVGRPGKRILLRAHLSTHPDELTTARLRLRHWDASDYGAFGRLNQNVEVNRYLPGPLTQEESDEVANRIVYRLARDGFGYWAVELLETETTAPEHFIGFVGLGPVTELRPVRERLGHPGLEVGWRLFPEFWNKGYATEAALSAVRYAREKLHASEVVSFTVPGNQGSRRVMEKIGLAHDPRGDFLHPVLPKEHPLARHVLYRKAF